MLNPFVSVLIVLILFCLLIAGYLWVDSVPREKKHKRITWIRRLK
jgi:hypothetical protein